MCRLEETTMLTTRCASVLVEQTEGALLSLVTLASEILQRLSAREHLAAAYNATMLVLNEILLLQTTGRVLGRAMENLGLGTSGNFKLGHRILRVAILTSRGQLTPSMPFYLL